MEATKYILIIVFAIIIAWVIDSNRRSARKKHDENHPGIVEGNNDIICPKCKCPYCEYVFEQQTTEVTTYRYRPLHPLKPLKSKTRQQPNLFQKKKYRCKNCGWIFE